MNVLATVFVIAAVSGTLASLTAFAIPERRHGALTVATACYAVAGLLGILSVGVFFLVAAIMCGSRLAQTYASPTTPAEEIIWLERTYAEESYSGQDPTQR